MALLSLAKGEDDEFTGYDRLAQKIMERYQATKEDVREENKVRLAMQPLKEIRRDVLARMMEQYPPELMEQLKSRLPTSMVAPPAAPTNAPPGAPANTTNGPPAQPNRR